MSINPLTIYPPDEDTEQWHVIGDLREIIDLDGKSSRYIESTNYAVQERLIAEGWPAVELDPEYSCFFGYVDTEDRARTLQSEAIRLAESLRPS